MADYQAAKDPDFPFELLFIIFANLNLPNLLSTALVCRSWCTASRGFIFHTIEVDLSKFSGGSLYRTLLVRPDLINLVREVAVYGDSTTRDLQLRSSSSTAIEESHALIANAFQLLTRVDALQIYLSGREFYWCDLIAPLQHALAAIIQMPTLTVLRLDEWFFATNRSPLQQLLTNASSSLKRIEFVGPSCSWYGWAPDAPLLQSHRGSITSQSKRTPSPDRGPNDTGTINLEELLVDMRWTSQGQLPSVHMWILSSIRNIDLTHLRSLRLSLPPENPSYVSKVLEVSGPSLRRLHLTQLESYPFRHQGMDLSQAVSLRSLILQSDIALLDRDLVIPPRWHIDTLFSLTLPARGIEEIGLTFVIQGFRYEQTPNAFKFRDIITFLASEANFPALKTFRLVFRQCITAYRDHQPWKMELMQKELAESVLADKIVLDLDMNASIF